MRIIFAVLFLLIGMEPLAANEIRTTQKLLTDLGYQAGPIDGQYGQKTENALVQFYNSQGLGFDGKLGSNEILDLKFELARFNVTADEINFPGSFYTSELKPCTAMGYGSFNLQNNIASVSSLIGYDWHADHQKNSNSQTVIHDKITVPIKKLLQSTHNAITSDDQFSINVAADLLTRIAEADSLYDSIGFHDVMKKPRCYANGDPKSPCWYHEYEFARGVFSNYMVAALWLKNTLSDKQFMDVDRYIDKMYAKFLRPVERQVQEQGFYQMANGGLSILIYASWKSDKALAAEEIKFRFKEMDRIIYEDGYINNNSFRGVRSQWYHSYGLNIALGYAYIAELWGTELPYRLKNKLFNASKVANLAITDWEDFKKREFIGSNRNKIKGKDSAIRHTHQMAIAIDVLMPLITGVELENDPEYLKKRRYHMKDGIDDLIGFNPNCI